MDYARPNLKSTDISNEMSDIDKLALVSNLVKLAKQGDLAAFDKNSL